MGKNWLGDGINNKNISVILTNFPSSHGCVLAHAVSYAASLHCNTYKLVPYELITEGTFCCNIIAVLFCWVTHFPKLVHSKLQVFD